MASFLGIPYADVAIAAFLPALLFQAALTIDVRRMMEDAAPILLLAVVAVFVATAVIGLALWPLAGVPLVVCLMLGSIVATTDPAAVIAIFRDIGAPARLVRLVEGESLLNDAAAISIFTILLSQLTGQHPMSFAAATLTFVSSFAGGLAGALCVAAIPTDLLRYLLPVLLIAIAVFFALKPGLNDLDRARRLSPGLFTASVVPLIAFYDGLLGPGTGAFLMLGFVMLAGYGILKATAHTKLLNFASNLGGLVAFAAVGKPLWLLGAAMAVAQIAGATLGARLAMRIGARIIKPLLVATSTLLALRLIWQML